MGSHFFYCLFLLASSEVEQSMSLLSVQQHEAKKLCYNASEISQHFCLTSHFSKPTVGQKDEMLLPSSPCQKKKKKR